MTKTLSRKHRVNVSLVCEEGLRAKVASQAPGENWVVVGRLGAPYGVHGWQHVHSFTNPIENLLQYSQWYIHRMGSWVPYQAVGRPHGTGLVAQLHGVNEREAAGLFANCPIAVERTQLPALPLDEFYWADLENLGVQTKEGKPLGQISYLYENAGLDVLVIKQHAKEYHIPFVMHDVVLKVDLLNRLVTVDWDLFD